MRINTKHIRIYPWHSINLIPTIALVMIYDDEVVPEKLGCMLEAAVLGYVLHDLFGKETSTLVVEEELPLL